MRNNLIENNSGCWGVQVYDHISIKNNMEEPFVWGDQDWRLYHCSRTIESIEEQGYIMDNNGRYIPTAIVDQLLLNAINEVQEEVVYQDRVISYGDFSWEKLHRYSEV